MKKENKITKLKVKIEEPGKYGLGYISGNISIDRPTIIDWGNGTTTTFPTQINGINQQIESTDFYTNYSEPGEYVISIDGWYNYFTCYNNSIWKSDVTQINKVLIEIIQVSSLITSFRNTFRGCSSLESIPPGLFDNNADVTDFTSTFFDCSSLTSIPFGLFDNNTDVTKFVSTFRGCSSLTSIPTGLFDKNTKVTHFIGIFKGCSSLINIPSRLFEKNTNVTDFFSVFYDCSSLTSIPSDLFCKNTKVKSFSWVFIGCSNLKGETPYTLSSDGHTKIKLWNRNETNGFTNPEKTGRTFYGCKKLSDYEDIPSDWK